jgi:hypothetical protein
VSTITIQTDIENINIDLDSFEHKQIIKDENIENLIIHYDEFLDKLSIPRAKINELKKAKDKIVKEYIYETKAPKTLDINLLNYKALLFYFKDSFMKKTLTLKYEHYKNDISKLQPSKKESLKIYFIEDKVSIKLLHNNFPHLIGIKKPSNTINHNYIDEFLDDIFYETKLLEDYQSHKGDINKIKTFSWIYTTLRNPTYIVENDAIKKEKSNFESDLVFIRKIFHNDSYDFHIVGLSKIEHQNYVIKSQFPIKENELYKKINLKKKIFQKVRGGRS